MAYFGLLNNFFKKILPFSPLILLPACSTITGGPHQKINIDTGKIRGASCHLSNSKGSWLVNSTPSVVTVHRASDNLCVKCTKNTLKGNTKVASKIKPTTFGNALMIGGLLWTAVDIKTGSAYDYPNKVSVQLSNKPIMVAKKDKVNNKA